MSAFRHTIDIPADPQAVFAAFKDPVRLARWWGPDGFSNTFDTFEFRPGGRWKFTMHGPDKRNYPNESVFLEIIPQSLIRLKHAVLPYYDLTISFESSETGTLVSWFAVFENEAFAEKMRKFLETANEQNLHRLASVVIDAEYSDGEPESGGND